MGTDCGVPAGAAAGVLAGVTRVGVASGPSSGVVTPGVWGGGGAAPAGSGCPVGSIEGLLAGVTGKPVGAEAGPSSGLHCLDSAVKKKKKMRQIELASLVGHWEAHQAGQQGCWQSP